VLAVVLLLSLALFPRFRDRGAPATDAPAPELREGETAAQAAGPSQPADRRR
jgi:putative amide transporter protein